MTNLDSILKSRDITLPTNVCLVKATFSFQAALRLLSSVFISLGRGLYFPLAGVYIADFGEQEFWGFPIGKRRLSGKQLNIIHTEALSHCFPINIDNTTFCQKKL